MFRYRIGLFVSIGLAFPLQAQGTTGEPVKAHFCWYNVPTDVRAIAVTSIVTMSSSPLGTGLVNLAAGMPVDPRTVGTADPIPSGLPTAASGPGLGGGSVPPGFFKPSSPAGGSAGAGGAGPSGGAAASTPDEQWWSIGKDTATEEGTTNPSVPVEIQPTIDTPEPATLLMGGMGLAAVAGWRLRRKRITSTQPSSESA